MLMPSLFGENLLDEFFETPHFARKSFGNGQKLMNTDVKEHETGYEIDISLPGYKKEDIRAELKDGYLTISAKTSQSNDQKDEKTGKYIRRERYTGSCSRSFYVGEKVQKEDIHPKFENGILSFDIPKETKTVENNNNYIAIEG